MPRIDEISKIGDRLVLGVQSSMPRIQMSRSGLPRKERPRTGGSQNPSRTNPECDSQNETRDIPDSNLPRRGKYEVYPNASAIGRKLVGDKRAMAKYYCGARPV